jgi:uncharacterized protein YecA (UPF0149 family)
MNRQQRKNFIKGMYIKERLSIAVSMPPKEKPITKEFNIGRNDKCPCGSEKKYKNCCMKSGKYENYKTNE